MKGNRSTAVPSAVSRGSTHGDDSAQLSKRAVRAWAGSIGLVAGFISVLGSRTPSVWSDEAATISASTRSWGELGHLLSRVDIVHGAYYSLMHVWFGFFGVSPLTLRLPSALAVAIAASGVVVLSARLSSLRVAIFAGAVFSVLPRVTWMGTEGRSSAVATAAAVWLSVLLVVALHRSGRVIWAWYGLAAACAVSIWIYLALLVVAHGVAVVWGSGSRRHDLAAWVVAACGGLLLASPVILMAGQQAGQVSWLQRPTFGIAKSIAVDQWFGTDGLRSLPLALACWIIIGIALVRAFRAGDVSRPRPSLFNIAFPWLILPTVGLVCYSLLLTPIYFPKYVGFSAPAVAMIVGEFVATLRLAWMRYAALAGIAILAIPSYVSERTLTAKDGSDWASVASTIEQNKKSGDAVIYGDLYNPGGVVRSTARVIDIAYPSSLDGLWDVTRGELAGPRGVLWDASLPLAEASEQLADTQRVWLVSDHAREPAGRSSAELTALSTAGFVPIAEWPGSKTDLTLLARP